MANTRDVMVKVRREVGDHEGPPRLASGAVPSRALADSAEAIADRLWAALSGQGPILLNILMVNAEKETVRVTPDVLAEMFGHPRGGQRVAGVLGGGASAVRDAFR